MNFWTRQKFTRLPLSLLHFPLSTPHPHPSLSALFFLHPLQLHHQQSQQPILTRGMSPILIASIKLAIP